MPELGNMDFSLAGTCAWTPFHPEPETGVSAGVILGLSDLFQPERFYDSMVWITITTTACTLLIFWRFKFSSTEIPLQIIPDKPKLQILLSPRSVKIIILQKTVVSSFTERKILSKYPVLLICKALQMKKIVPFMPIKSHICSVIFVNLFITIFSQFKVRWYNVYFISPSCTFIFKPCKFRS